MLRGIVLDSFVGLNWTAWLTAPPNGDEVDYTDRAAVFPRGMVLRLFPEG